MAGTHTIAAITISAVTNTILNTHTHPCCVQVVHQSVEEKTKEFWDSLRRRNYVTPTSYLELLSTFKTVLEQKRVEVSGTRNAAHRAAHRAAHT